MFGPGGMPLCMLEMRRLDCRVASAVFQTTAGQKLLNAGKRFIFQKNTRVILVERSLFRICDDLFLIWLYSPNLLLVCPSEEVEYLLYEIQWILIAQAFHGLKDFPQNSPMQMVRCHIYYECADGLLYDLLEPIPRCLETDDQMSTASW